MDNRHVAEYEHMYGLLTSLENYKDRNPGKGDINELEHSLQTATRAKRYGADDEMICVALLHDAAKPLTEIYHGEAISIILSEYLSPNRIKVLEHHSKYQDAAWNNRQILIDTDWKLDASRLGKWDAASFDPKYNSLSLSYFIPKLRHLYMVD